MFSSVHGFGGVVLHPRCVGVYSMGNYYEGKN